MDRKPDNEDPQSSPRLTSSDWPRELSHSLTQISQQSTLHPLLPSFFPYRSTPTSPETSSISPSNELNNHSTGVTRSPLPYVGLFGNGYGTQPTSFRDAAGHSSQRAFPVPVQGHTPSTSQQRGHMASPSTSKAALKPKLQNESNSSESEEDGHSLENGVDQFTKLYLLGDEPDRKEFLDELFAFHQSLGTPINKVPTMDKKLLDLYMLFKLVVQRGGLCKVITKKLWREVAKELKLSQSITSAAFTLRSQYNRYLYGLECKKYKFSTIAEVTAAIDSNKRDGRKNSTMSSLAAGMLPLAMLPQAQFNLPALAQMMGSASQMRYPFGYPVPSAPFNIGPQAAFGMPPVASSTAFPSMVPAGNYSLPGEQRVDAIATANHKKLIPDGDQLSAQGHVQTPKKIKSDNGSPVVDRKLEDEVRVSKVEKTEEGMFVTMWRNGMCYSGHVYPNTTDERK